MKRALITGNTFPVKEGLKALGGRWNPTARGWEVPWANAVEARALVAGAGNTRRAEPKAYFPPDANTDGYDYRTGGDCDGTEDWNILAAREAAMRAPRYPVYRRRGRCEDAPCCGCCD